MPDPENEAEDAIPFQEELHLARAVESLRAAAPGAARDRRGHANDELLALRDEIGEARLEDVPALVAQMERLQEVSLTRAELQTLLVDPRSPYFGHLRLRERVAGRGDVERDVFIGRATFTDAKARVHIVDWRNAPISQLYYCYSEGSDYEETFGPREVEGDIVQRRTVTIEDGELLRVASPQGVWVKSKDASVPSTSHWRRTDVPVRELAGGERMAMRPAPRRGLLGSAPEEAQKLDRHLPEIAALIDPRQFEIMTAPHSGVVVIQGGAGSGKTTIGLHRLAYLNFAHPERFPAKRMVVVTQGTALAGYIGQVLPALGVSGVRVLTFQEWAERELQRAIPWLHATITDEVVPAVTRVKSHPALLHELERRAHSPKAKRGKSAVVELWADLLTDRKLLLLLMRDDPEMRVSEADIDEAHRILVTRVSAIVSRDPRELPPEEKKKSPAKSRADERARKEELEDIRAWTSLGQGEGAKKKTVDDDLPEHVRRIESERDEVDDDENVRGEIGIDGQRTEDDLPILDLDDLAILLRANQLLRKPETPLCHLFVDEAQDLSPMKLAALIGRTAPSGHKGRSGIPSITLAGDTAQRLFLDNGFGDWRAVLGHLGLSAVAVEPLRIAYRSTREILALARHAMGPLPIDVPAEAKRSGAPVEAFRFSAAGAAVGFLAEALRDLLLREPRATVALLARHAEQADRYFEGLRRSEVASLRRVRAQDFTFRPGIDVTDVRQVKGLEFDYVVLLDVNASSYGSDDESRHLFHIAATRAAHQLWLIVTGRPS
ncbi:MAG TPA: ATP-binding domain-containing protein, partial [Polyangia bacterium]